MKKIVTLIYTALLASTMMAEDYQDRLVVDINGSKVEQMATISVNKQANGTYTLSLQNFILEVEGSQMPIGNITLENVEGVTTNGQTMLTASQEVNITDGTQAGIQGWMGATLGPVPVKMASRLAYGKLTTAISIYMEALQQNINVYFGKENKGYQIPNADFELFRKEGEPVGWHSFGSATGSMATNAFFSAFLPKVAKATGPSGQCVSIKAQSVFGTIANGTMTTGRMNAGSATATDKTNNAYIDMSKEDKDSNGDPFYTHMDGNPDSLAVWIKFTQKTPHASFPYATISAAITDGTYYQDPEDKTYSNVVATAKNNKIASNDQWQRLSIPFQYAEGKKADAKALMVTISTNAQPGGGSGDEEILVDDIELVYNNIMTALSINGKAVEGISKDKTTYEIATDLTSLTAGDISVTAHNPKAPIVKTLGKKTGDQQKAEITIFGEDLRSAVTYTLNMTHTPAAPTGIDPINASSEKGQNQVFNLNGQRVLTPQPGQVYIIKQHDGSTKKTTLK